MTITQKLRGRRVTHEEAAESAQRLVNSHFHNPDSARCSIPANPADDDLIVTDYILEQKEIEGEIAMSKEVELPPYSLAEWIGEREQNALRIAETKTGEDRICWLEDAEYFTRTREALARIATLSAQVEELTRKGAECASVLGNIGIHIHELGLRNAGAMGEWKYRNERAEKAEAELTNECAATPEYEERDDWAVRALNAEAELAALREGATVRYCVQRFSVAYGDFVDFQTNCENIEEAQAIADHITLIQNRPRIVEVITRERILDATETPDAKA